jgi:hypothetical protein
MEHPSGFPMSSSFSVAVRVQDDNGVTIKQEQFSLTGYFKDSSEMLAKAVEWTDKQKREARE